MGAVTMPVKKMLDAELIDRLKKCQQIDGVPFQKISITTSILQNRFELTDPQWQQDKALAQLIALQGEFISKVVMLFAQDSHVSVSRANDYHDTVTIQCNSTDTPTALRVASTCKKPFDDVVFRGLNLDFISKDLTQLYNFREATLNEQQQQLDSLFDKLQQFSLTLTQQQHDKVTKLDEQYAGRVKDLEQKHEAKSNDLAKQESELHEKIKELDLRESKAVRRELREKLKKEITDRLKLFTLSAETNAKRLPVLLTLIGAILLLIGFTVWHFSSYGSADANWFMYMRGTILAVATVAFVSYLVKWLNQWSQRHADEEFKTIRLSLDIDAASWLYEMSMDWRQEYKQDFPLELFKEFAKNVFSAEAGTEADLSPADHIASALFGESAKVNMKLLDDKIELQMDRESLKKLKKPQ